MEYFESHQLEDQQDIASTYVVVSTPYYALKYNQTSTNAKAVQPWQQLLHDDEVA